MKIIGISWGFDGETRVLPFGLSCSPYFFGKILKPVITYLREDNIRLCAYVDDFFLAASENDIGLHKNILVQTLGKLGWCINYEKSSLNPEQNKLHVGYDISTSGEPIIKIPLSRCRKLKKDIKRTVIKVRSSARVLARVTGQCVSML